MAEAKKSAEIGIKRGRIISNLSQPQQLDLVADGLPLLMKSANDLLLASKALDGHYRAASILEGHAMEEVAKILILMDIVRCPPNIRPARIGPMMGWFYDHLARLIYIDAQDWKPQDTKQLQEYVDSNRKSHYVEGAVGEYITPNWTTYSRESLLYADIVTYEEGEPFWNEPQEYEPMVRWREPSSWQVCHALRNMGLFTRAGLDVVSSVWSQVDFATTENWSDARRLTHATLLALEKAQLISKDAQESQVGTLYNHWQLPMYRIDFKRIEVPLEDLRAEQNANLWSEAGY
ncbi:hypothetical protein [Bradyrhizobium valentinum]|uniref:AbiV family abortive infection protein n=1 Tax=Bradyrhizobium valentinum TaxID=1518501 RepID=A0A0R3KFY3_9BRAD|nr:hypothetical protein [Bradyrhizobium valentinum]KRQ94499.1 hypothetical protein CP49_34120 [Bradyrhizobium valentinum]KRR05686.1 hypothetical protein CQ10_16805 [Bradyrhizobium valentinum]